ASAYQVPRTPWENSISRLSHFAVTFCGAPCTVTVKRQADPFTSTWGCHEIFENVAVSAPVAAILPTSERTKRSARSIGVNRMWYQTTSRQQFRPACKSCLPGYVTDRHKVKRPGHHPGPP